MQMSPWSSRPQASPGVKPTLRNDVYLGGWALWASQPTSLLLALPSRQAERTYDSVEFRKQDGLMDDVPLSLLSRNHGNNVFFFPVLIKAQFFLH